MAIKFKYSMQSILQYRENIEDTKKAALAEANLKLRQEKETLMRMEQDLATAIQEKVMKKQNNITDEIIFINYVEISEERIDEQKQNVLKAEDDVEIARNELQNAKKDRKIIETLKEKEFTRFIADLDAKEVKELDDIVTSRFGRE